MKWREILCPWSEIRRQRGWIEHQSRMIDDLLTNWRPKQARDSKGRFISRTRPTQ